YDFVQWTGDGTPAGQDVQVTMDDDKTVAAEYAIRQHTLAVSSAPITGIDITGDKPGTTDYTETCDDQEVVSLTAPEIIPGSNSRRHNFAYWMVDDVAQAYGQTELQLTMDTDHIAMAIYDWRLDGDTNDDCTTNILDLIYIRNHLNAHLDTEQSDSANAGPAGDTVITGDAAIAEAVTHILTVGSAPMAGAAISGDKPGTTNYAAVCDDEETVALTAVRIVPGPGDAQHYFLYWMVDNEVQPYGQRELQLTMNTDHTAMAIYDLRLEGDTNGDGMVNILDMTYLLGRYYMRCED
ncbi:MAG: hypothetical protein HQ592_15040, partial [Planctomycetes bacterium]|nr:hypothetical protein [Planctomycetota bacterium]